MRIRKVSSMEIAYTARVEGDGRLRLTTTPKIPFWYRVDGGWEKVESGEVAVSWPNDRANTVFVAIKSKEDGDEIVCVWWHKDGRFLLIPAPAQELDGREISVIFTRTHT